MTAPMTPDEPDDITRALAEIEAHLGDQQPPDLDGNTDRVRAMEAHVAEADRIRDLPTRRVLDREQTLAEERALAALDTKAHASRLRDRGERDRAELAARADSAADRRELEANTHVRALQLSHRRRSRTLILWGVLTLAMSYTAVNVQKFAAGTASAWSAQWVVAWFVDPVLSALVVALLLTRGDLAAFSKPAGESRWDRRVVPLVELGALSAALLMNVSPEIQAHAAWESITLHVVIPLAAVAAALALPVVQRRYADAISGLYDRGPTAAPTPPGYRANTGSPPTPVGGPTGSLVARARAMVDTGQLPPDPSATRLQKALRCAMDRAREVRDALKEG